MEAFADYKRTANHFRKSLFRNWSESNRSPDALGIPRVELPGFEADDIIGTLAEQAVRQGFTVWCVTSDKDFYQLVSDRIFLLKPNGGGADYQVHGVEQCRERFGFEPHQVVV